MKYWAYINSEILGPYEKEKLLELRAFSASTLLVPQTPAGEKTEDWKEASAYPEIAPLFNSPAIPAVDTPKPAVPPSAAEAAAPQPEAHLKPLSFHHIDPAPPAASQPLEGVDLKVNRLNSSGRIREKEQSGFTSGNFDPMSLSQITRPAETPAKEPAAAELNPPHAAVPSPAPDADPSFRLIQTPAFEMPEQNEPSPGRAAPEKPLDAPAFGEDAQPLNSINLRLETLAKAALTKQDIEPLREKLDQAEAEFASFLRRTWPQFSEQAAQSSAKIDQIQREMMDKMRVLENSISEIKSALTQAPAAAAPKAAVTERILYNAPAPQPLKVEVLAPSEPRQPKKQETRTVIVDKGSSGVASMLSGIVKKLPRIIVTLVLLASVPVVAAFVLRQLGILDVTRALPFRIPFLHAPPEKRAAGAPVPQPSQQADAVPTPAPAASPEKDLSPEIIYIGRTFSLKAGGSTLENKIQEDAAAQNGDFNKTVWQVGKIRDGVFELTGAVPVSGGAEQLTYRYEVDYVRRTVTPLNGTAQKPMNALIREKDLSERTQAPRIGKTGKVPGAAADAKRPKQTAKRVKAKVTAPDDEYEYAYEEEPGGTEE